MMRPSRLCMTGLSVLALRLGYDSVLAASGGSFLSGISSRLSGGVGVAF